MADDRYRVPVTDPRQAVRRATEHYRKAEARHQEARQALVEALVAALRVGVPPSEVAELSPYSAAHLRMLAREHGIPPAPRGGPGKPRERKASG